MMGADPSVGELIYLASPYTDPDPAVMQARFEAVCRKAAELSKQGHIVFSPIAHSHPIQQAGGLPGDWSFWEKFDRIFLRCCGQFWILRLEGWRNSKGLANEKRIAKDLKKPVREIDP